MLDRLQLQEPAELTTTHAHKLLEVLPNTLAEEAYLPLLDVHVVRDRCAACRDCLVLETTFLLAYDTDFEPLDSNDMQNPCRSHCSSDHAFMCECARASAAHIGSASTDAATVWVVTATVTASRARRVRRRELLLCVCLYKLLRRST